LSATSLTLLPSRAVAQVMAVASLACAFEDFLVEVDDFSMLFKTNF